MSTTPCTLCNKDEAIKKTWTKSLWCKACWFLKKQKYDKDWKTKNPEAKKLGDKRWRENNKEYKKMKDRAYHLENREERLASMKRYQKNNVLRCRVLKWEHMGKTHTESDRTVTLQTVCEKLKEQDYKCTYCLVSLDIGFQIDHKLPFARGGIHTLNNIHFVCQSCNYRKHTRTHEEFLEYRTKTLQ